MRELPTGCLRMLQRRQIRSYRHLFRILINICALTLAAMSPPAKAQRLGDILVTTSNQVVYDGVSVTNAKLIPAAVIDFTTQIANRSNLPTLPNSLVVTNPVPEHLVLYVGDLAGIGSGPVSFTEGPQPSQLGCVFVGIADGGDCLEFSNNGGATFSYQPAPDAEGYDASVTDIRMRLQGSIAPAFLKPSSFLLRYRMKVK